MASVVDGRRSVAGELEINWTKTAHRTHAQAYSSAMCRYICSWLRVEHWATEGLSSRWPSDRSSSDSNNSKPVGLSDG